MISHKRVFRGVVSVGPPCPALSLESEGLSTCIYTTDLLPKNVRITMT